MSRKKEKLTEEYTLRKLSANFPSKKVVLFGNIAIEERGRIGSGYAALLVELPRTGQVGICTIGLGTEGGRRDILYEQRVPIEPPCYIRAIAWLGDVERQAAENRLIYGEILKKYKQGVPSVSNKHDVYDLGEAVIEGLGTDPEEPLDDGVITDDLFQLDFEYTPLSRAINTIASFREDALEAREEDEGEYEAARKELARKFSLSDIEENNLSRKEAWRNFKRFVYRGCRRKRRAMASQPE